MTYCPVCQRETPPVKIGGQIYCSVCGTAAPAHAQPTPAASRRISLDLSPRNRGNVTRPADPAPLIPKAPAPHAQAADAHALHRRVKPSHVLDLSAAHAHPVIPPELVTAPHHTPAAPPSATTHERHMAHFTDRFEQARQIPRSPVINKFSGPRLANPAPADHRQSGPHPVTPAIERELPQLVATHHEAMTRLAPVIPAATPASHTGAGTPWRPHLGLSPNTNRTVATVAAVAIMGGYIWLQNYPKLALQNAGSQAGIAASLPGYLPSSYSLKTTNTSPGLVTLNFTSPSAAQSLKIAQHRTTWDSSSLLDNYVAKATDDYATVQGQGLTIYLFNDNQASWVNRGIWYSIEGAGRLSREQILKIAYSL